MINYSKLCASLQENLMNEFYVNWSEVKFKGCIQSYMLPWKLRKRQILPVNKNLSSIYFSLAKFQPFSCHDLANDICSQTSKTVFSHLKRLPLRMIIRALRSHDADGNENVKEQQVLLVKQQLCTCITLFVHFFSRFYTTTNMRLLAFAFTIVFVWTEPEFRVFIEDVKTTKCYLSFFTWIWCLGIQLQEGSPTFDKVSG